MSEGSGPTWDQFLEWERRERNTVDWKRVYAFMAPNRRGPCHKTGLLLAQIVYYHLPQMDGRGKKRADDNLTCTIDGGRWLRSPRDFWWDTLGLNERQIDPLLNRLVREHRIVHREKFAWNGSPTTHIRLDGPRFLEAHALALLELERGGKRVEVPAVGVELPQPPGDSDSGAIARPPADHAANEAAANALMAVGVKPETRAWQLVTRRGAELVMAMIQAYQLVWKPAGKKIGYLLQAIEEGWSVPAELELKLQQEKDAAAGREREAQRAVAAAEKKRLRDLALEQLRVVWDGMTKDQQSALDNEARTNLPDFLRSRERRGSSIYLNSLLAERWKLLAARRDIDLPEEC